MTAVLLAVFPLAAVAQEPSRKPLLVTEAGAFDVSTAVANGGGEWSPAGDGKALKITTAAGIGPYRRERSPWLLESSSRSSL
jgi:hypothetical protein